MKILYITALPGLDSAGPSWSVPASIKAQNKIDECLWVNVTKGHLDHWNKVECYHNISDFGKSFDLSIMPEPFNHPDVVVFEDFYEIQPPLIARKLRIIGVPYIIVPRGALTQKAQNNQSKWKKNIANAFLFKKYVKKALAIQFLTLAEKTDTGDGWNTSSFILPNGFCTPEITKHDFSATAVNATFIGRLDVYHKGIDILLEACKDLAKNLRDINFKLCIYGPKNGDYEVICKTTKDFRIDDFVSLNGETSGKAKENVILNSDLFVLTSRFEGHPMGLIEALAYGVPALVTPGTNMANEIEKSDAGWVCKDATKEDIKEQLQKIIEERALFPTKGENAALLAKNYDWDTLAKRFHDEVESILHTNYKL